MFGKDDEAPIKARSCKVCRKFFKDASEPPTADCSACKPVNQDSLALFEFRIKSNLSSVRYYFTTTAKLRGLIIMTLGTSMQVPFVQISK